MIEIRTNPVIDNFDEKCSRRVAHFRKVGRRIDQALATINQDGCGGIETLLPIWLRNKLDRFFVEPFLEFTGCDCLSGRQWREHVAEVHFNFELLRIKFSSIGEHKDYDVITVDSSNTGSAPNC